MLHKAKTIFLALAVALASGCALHSREMAGMMQDSVFQVSTFAALSSGLYESDIPYGRIKQRGDFGLGTFESLDGEMVALGGEYFQVHFDGKLTRVKDAQTSPFATVKFFYPDLSFRVDERVNFQELKQLIDSRLPYPNLIYAIKIEGVFRFITARSVPKQEKPYKTLQVVTKGQSVFYFDDIQGTLVGFRMPAYLDGFNIGGYHFHFISSDKNKGGHALDLTLANGTVYIDVADSVTAAFPRAIDKEMK